MLGGLHRCNRNFRTSEKTMKAISEEQSNLYKSDGSWGDVTLDRLFRDAAAAHPDRLAIADAPDRKEWTGGTPRKLTYAEADQEIDKLAGFFDAVGLKTDHVIGIQAPNTTDAVIVFLAAVRAGLVLALLPLHWRQKNVLEALNSVGAKGFIAADRVETRMTGAAARDVAADLFTLRFVFGLGNEIPDGLIELAPMLAEMGGDLHAPLVERENAADHVASISWSRSGGEPKPVTRSHNHWITAARQLLAEMPVGDGADIVMPYALTGLTGFGGGLVPWLLNAGTLHLHHPTSLFRLARHANLVKADYVLTPGPLAQALDRALKDPDTALVAAWNISSPAPTVFDPQHNLIDLHVADEFAFVARPRKSSSSVEPVPLGKLPGPGENENGPPLLQIGTEAVEQGSGHALLVKGPASVGMEWRSVSKEKSVAIDNEGFIKTGILVETVGDGLAGFGVPGTYAVGSIDLDQIDQLYMTFPELQDAASFLVDDDIIGARLYAAIVPAPNCVPDTKMFLAYLEAAGVDMAQMPFRVLMLQSLPRLSDGTVDRGRLTLRTQRIPARVA